MNDDFNRLMKSKAADHKALKKPTVNKSAPQIVAGPHGPQGLVNEIATRVIEAPRMIKFFLYMLIRPKPTN